MATFSTSEFKNGLKVLIDGEPCSILENEVVKPGKGQAFNRVRMRNLKNGRVWERTYKSGESLEGADVMETDMQYLYSDGEFWHFMKTDDSFEQIAADEAAIADWGLPFAGRFGGLIKGDALQAMINREVKNRPIEQMRIPLGVVATDLQSGKGVLFRRGDTGMAVRASCSIPGVFQPATIQGREYVDGGLVAPVPVQYAKQMGATVVIAVSISNEPGQQNASGTLGVLQQTISIMQQSINSYELQSADIVIQPKLQQMGGADFKARSAAILAGEIATQEKMAQIKALISA